jgi:NADP-dependent 3-hydroxy acid dehydrogenase YdfG
VKLPAGRKGQQNGVGNGMASAASGLLSGRVALVCGASSGIGEGAALALAAAGAKVALAARRAERLNDLAARIEAAGGQALVLPGDLGDEAFASEAVARTVARFERLDILVNSAGALRAGGVEHADTAEWLWLINLNLMASLYTSRAAIPQMKAQGGGDIINISSLSGRYAAAAFGAYGASKHAIEAMSEGLRQEVGAFGIRVCAIQPGATRTEVADGVAEPMIRDAMRDYVGKEGVMLPADIGETIVFIAALPPRANISNICLRPTMDTVAHPALMSNEGLMP